MLYTKKNYFSFFFFRKLLQSLPNCELQSSLLANYLDVMDTEVKVELLLTNELLLMIGVDEDSQQQAFSLVELEVKVQPDNPQLLTFIWKDSFHQSAPQVCLIYFKELRAECHINIAMHKIFY